MVVYLYSLTPPESFVLKGGTIREEGEKERKKCRFVHLQGIELETLETWWISTARLDQKEKMQFGARAGDRTEIGWISTSRPSLWAIMGSHNLT